MNGIEMMLKSAGIDIEKITKDFESLKDGVVKTLQEINTRLTNLESRGENMAKQQSEILALVRGIQVLEVADHLGQIRTLTEELTAWKRQLMGVQETANTLRQLQPQLVLAQVIIACRTCGAPVSAPCQHNSWVTMTKQAAAATAIRWATAELVDRKTASTGEKE
jgi:DNA repair exonuclease SbcCD ATPase subunit